MAFAPYITSVSLRSFLLFLLMWIALSQSFNMFTGLTGYVNFGFVAFYGLGKYWRRKLIGIPSKHTDSTVLALLVIGVDLFAARSAYLLHSLLIPNFGSVILVPVSVAIGFVLTYLFLKPRNSKDTSR